VSKQEIPTLVRGIGFNLPFVGWKKTDILAGGPQLQWRRQNQHTPLGDPPTRAQLFLSKVIFAYCRTDFVLAEPVHLAG
jgi:hypothetical protein